MPKHLFLFTISPVQSFIAQARKTQDLYAGSRILSELIKAAINKIVAEKGNVIFPKPKGESLPNRLVAVIEKPENELKEFGKNIEAAVKTEFKKIAKKVANETNIKEFSKIEKAFDDQIAKHLEIYWVFNEIKGESYTAEEYQKTERLLGAVKNVRAFQQFTYNGIGETGRKCSLDGERNALFFGKGTNKKYIEDNHAIPLEEDEVKVAINEGLSAVSFVKRFRLKEKFESTSEIALMDSLHKIGSKEVGEFEKVFGKHNLLYQAEKEGCIKIDGKDWKSFNEQFFYEENLIANNIPCKAQLEIAKKRHKDLQEVFEKQKVKFLKYYAILTFDGDSMGKWLGADAKFFEEVKDIQKFHTDLSTRLSEFAEWAKNYLQMPKGKTVYAGGDDFLGFVNLTTLFDVLQELRSNFDCKVSKKLKEEKIAYKVKENVNFSFSAGICVAHYKEPLSLVLGKARAMQETAKEFTDKDNEETKNNFAIHVIKGSGETHITVWKNDKISDLQKVVKYLKSDNFSDTFLRSLQIEFSNLVSEKDELLVKSELLKFELYRLVLRSCSLKGEAKKTESKLFADLLFSLFEQNEKVTNFFECLNICNFIKRNIN